jgi:hypothetical protein
MSDPATRSQAAWSNRGAILNAVAVCPALRPRRRLLAIGDRNLASLDRPSVENGAATIHDLPTGWAMDRYYGLIALLFVVLGIAGVFVWVYLPPR